MKFDNRTLNNNVRNACIKASELLLPNSELMSELKIKNDFKFNSGTGIEIYTKIYKCTKVVPVFTYKPWNIFSSALGYYDGKSIHINNRKLPEMSFDSLVGLLCHEYLHAVGFKHGNNYPSEEKNNFSVNYYVSNNIKKWL